MSELEKELVLLTKSSKYNGYCVVGLELKTGKFIRLISKNEMIKGSLSDNHLICTNGKYADCLDVVRVKLENKDEKIVHQEDWFIDENIPMEYVRKIELEELKPFISIENQYIFGSNYKYIDFEEAKNQFKSIILAVVDDIKIYKNEKGKMKINFTYNNNNYKDFAVTDPFYYEIEGFIECKKALILFSLPDVSDEWVRSNNKFYKYASKIINIDDEVCFKDNKNETLNYLFEHPQKFLDFLTSINISYENINPIAEKLVKEIDELHTNQQGNQYRAYTQCILECIKRIHGFKSTKWYNCKTANNRLKEGEKFIEFSRNIRDGERVNYILANEDQIDCCELKDYKASDNQIKQKDIESSDDEDYLKLLQLLKNGENVFLTGFAGTGKSYLLNKMKNYFGKDLTITSTTGIAAVNVKGTTLHSWASVGRCNRPVAYVVEKIKSQKSLLIPILKCKILAIDEISMLNFSVFEYVNDVLKAIRECDKPFGGIQVLFIGDFFQLPPVEQQTEEVQYCFNSHVWKELGLKNVILKKNYRQDEEKFITALANMRENKLTDRDIRLLNTRNFSEDLSDTNILHIFATNSEADKYNLEKFNKINSPIKTFYAQDFIFRGKNVISDGFTDSEKYTLEFFDKSCRAEKEINLKIGAKVMLLVNLNTNRGLINGSCGIVEEFTEAGIKVKFDNGVKSIIPIQTFEYYYKDKLTAKRVQYPLKLAYGITIHKSQGMTLSELVVDCSRIFAKGQAYVALSRVKSLDGLYLKHFSIRNVMVEEKVVEFYNNLKECEVKLSEQVDFESYQTVTSLNDIKEIKNIILEFIKEYPDKYGKSGISKILKASSSIKLNDYNNDIQKSKYYGILKHLTQKKIYEIIEELILENKIQKKKIEFGRPVLHIINK